METLSIPNLIIMREVYNCKIDSALYSVYNELTDTGTWFIDNHHNYLKKLRKELKSIECVIAVDGKQTQDIHLEEESQHLYDQLFPEAMNGSHEWRYDLRKSRSF